MAHKHDLLRMLVSRFPIAAATTRVIAGLALSTVACTILNPSKRATPAGTQSEAQKPIMKNQSAETDNIGS